MIGSIVPGTHHISSTELRVVTLVLDFKRRYLKSKEVCKLVQKFLTVNLKGRV